MINLLTLFAEANAKARANANANTVLLSLFGSVSDRPAAALGTLQAVPREGPGLLPERRRVLRHRDAQRATQALQVSDLNHNVAAAVVGGTTPLSSRPSS